MYVTGIESMNVIGKNRLLQFLLSRRLRLVRHVSLILLLLVVSLITTNKKEYLHHLDIYIGWGVQLIITGCMYINMYLLVPKFFFVEKYSLYVASCAGLLVASFALIAIILVILEPYRITRVNESTAVQEFLGYSVSFLFVMAASAAVKLFQRLVTDTQRISHLEQLTLRSELEQLKNQVNPHFLFNMLNNASVLIKKDAEKASHVLLMLSDLLRYQLYDSSRPKVLLSADIQFLTDFLSLEKIRRDQFVFKVSTNGDMNNLLIPPFLFIGFVENAIKHNLDPIRTSYVELYFSVKENRLFFNCKNSRPAIPVASGHQPGGLGLTNVKRRLELLYPNVHQLHIEDKTDSYTVTLMLPL